MDSPDDLNNLLQWLGQGTDAGARQYLEVRQKLVALFRLWGCHTAEDLADETLDRTAKAIVKPGFTCTTTPIAYLRGVARNVWLESMRRDRTVSQEFIPERAETRRAERGIESLHACLDQCLARLPQDKRSLLLRYYQGDKSAKIDGRVQLAQQEGLNLNTLRLKIFRLRDVVRRCVDTCTKTNEIEVRF